MEERAATAKRSDASGTWLTAYLHVTSGRHSRRQIAL
jgi:hypothetical protein